MGEFVMFMGLITLIERGMRQSLDLLWQIDGEIIDVEKLWETFDNAPHIHNIHSGKRFIIKNADIELKGIKFAYDNTPVLQNLNLHIKWKQKTALVWPSWGGKSTIIKLIGWYIRANEWDTLVDNYNLNEIRLADYYKHIGYLTQDPSVFDGTIIENLTYALNKKPTKKQLDDVINMSKCEFVCDFENQLETEIGERGVRLSGGQKQRLAIAKIMLKNPSIILLDEPTSALDSVSEQKISEAFHNLFKGKTVVVIAHRLQTVKAADDIIVIDKGQVIERWTHKELEKKDGLYKEMLDLQTTF